MEQSTLQHTVQDVRQEDWSLLLYGFKQVRQKLLEE